MKKILAILFVLIVAVSLVTVAVAEPATSGYCGVTEVNDGKDVTWSFDAATGTMTISGTGAMHDNYMSEWDAFRNDIADAVIEPGVTNVGGKKFKDCTKLTTVSIPSTVTSIGNDSFYNSGITSVTLPENLTSLGAQAFYNCQSLTGDIVIPRGVTKITELYTFAKTKITSVTFHDGMTALGNSSFSDCTELTSVVIPNSVITIGDNTFKGCTKLTSATLPQNEKYTAIAGGLFQNTALTSIEIPNSVTTIGASAFQDCKLTSVVIPQGVTTIGREAFMGNSTMTVAVIPDSVTAISDGNINGTNGAFKGMAASSVIYLGNTAQIKLIFPAPANVNSAANGYTKDNTALAVTHGGMFTAEPTDHTTLAIPIKAGYVNQKWWTKDGFNDNNWGTELTDAPAAGGTYYTKWENATYELQEPKTLDFGTVTYGYTIPAAQSVTFTTNDSVPTIKSVTGNTHFDVTVGSDGKSVIITPKAGLGVATYNEEISVELGNGDTVKIPVTMKVTPAPLTATYAGETIKAGDTPKLEVTVTGFVNGETAEVLATAGTYTAPTLSGTYDATKAGEYTLTPTGGTVANYAFTTYKPGVLKVERRSYGGGGSGTPTPDKTIESPKTFDAGIALYGVMALSSAMGAAYVVGKKH